MRDDFIVGCEKLLQFAQRFYDNFMLRYCMDLQLDDNVLGLLKLPSTKNFGGRNFRRLVLIVKIPAIR